MAIGAIVLAVVATLGVFRAVWSLCKGGNVFLMSVRSRLAVELRLAGFRWNKRGVHGLHGIFSRLAAGGPGYHTALLSGAFLIVGATVGTWAALLLGLAWLYWRRLKSRAQWRQSLSAELPEALEQLSTLLSGGLHLRSAMDRVGEQLDGPVADLFSMIWDSVSVGVPLDEALRRVDRRVGLVDVSLFCVSVTINHRVGGGLAGVMRRTADALHERRSLAEDLLVETTQARLSALVVGMLPLVVLGFLSLFSPTFLAPLFGTITGNFVLAVAAVANLTGFALIRRIMVSAEGAYV